MQKVTGITITSSMLQHVLQMSSSNTNTSGGRWRHSPTARSITADPERLIHCWCIISARRCTISKRIWLMFNDFRVSVIFSVDTRYPVWIHCCKRPNYDFWISQSSVATVFTSSTSTIIASCSEKNRCIIVVSGISIISIKYVQYNVYNYIDENLSTEFLKSVICYPKRGYHKCSKRTTGVRCLQPRLRETRASFSWGFWRPMTSTFGVFKWKLAHRLSLLLLWGTFTLILVFLRLLVVKLGSRRL